MMKFHLGAGLKDFESFLIFLNAHPWEKVSCFLTVANIFKDRCPVVCQTQPA